MEKWARHEHKAKRPLYKVGYTLLYNTHRALRQVGFSSTWNRINFQGCFCYGNFFLVVFLTIAQDYERLGVNRCLQAQSFIQVNHDPITDVCRFVTCGIRPFGAGTPSKPAKNVVIPSRKKSQWKPGGFRSGNSDPCAMSDYSIWSAPVSQA